MHPARYKKNWRAEWPAFATKTCYKRVLQIFIFFTREEVTCCPVTAAAKGHNHSFLSKLKCACWAYCIPIKCLQAHGVIVGVILCRTGSLIILVNSFQLRIFYDSMLKLGICLEMDFRGIKFLWAFHCSKETQGIGTVAKQKIQESCKALLSSAEHPQSHAQHVQLPLTEF